LSWSLGPTSQASSGSQRGPANEIGSGDDELVDVILSRPHDLELLFEKDVLTGSDIAGALLTGGKPRADLLPQKGSHVAPVATLLSGEGDDLAVSPTATDEEKAVLMELLINPMRKSIHPLSGISTHSVGHGPRANSGDERSALIEQAPGSNVPEEGKTSDERALRQCANALLLALGCGFLVATRARPRRTSSASCGRPSRTRWSQQLLAWLRAQFRK
jgi:hypothetical protein